VHGREVVLEYIVRAVNRNRHNVGIRALSNLKTALVEGADCGPVGILRAAALREHPDRSAVFHELRAGLNGLHALPYVLSVQELAVQELHPAAKRGHPIEAVLRKKTGLYRQYGIGADDVEIASVIADEQNALIPRYVLESQYRELLLAQRGPGDDTEYPAPVALSQFRGALRVYHFINPEYQQHREPQHQKKKNFKKASACPYHNVIPPLNG